MRSPVLRYAHKVLAHTMFARKDTGKIKQNEMCLLVRAAKSLISGDPFKFWATVNYGAILATQLASYKDWAMTTPDTPPLLSIGGVVTPILNHCKIKLGNPIQGSSRIDTLYLANSKFLAGSVSDQLAYRFLLDGNEHAKVLLPNTTITSLLVRENFIFKPPTHLLYQQSADFPLNSLKVNKRKKTRGDQAKGQGASQPPSIYGNERYRLPPLDVPLHSAVERYLYQSCHSLQRWSKWQDRTIGKLVKVVKGLKAQVKELKGKFTNTNPSQEEIVADSSEDEDHLTELMQVDLAINSCHGASTSSLIFNEAPPPSSHERHSRKRRPERSPTQSSSNPSLDLSLSDSSDSVQA